VLERDYYRVAILGLYTLIKVFPLPDYRKFNYNYKPEYIIILANANKYKIESKHSAIR